MLGTARGSVARRPGWDPRLMAAPHDPFEASNFIVDFGGAGGATMFSHVDLPVAVLDEIAYRSGNDKANEPRKQPGLASYSHLVLTRGLTADLDLWSWWESTRNGDLTDRDVVVRLLDATGQLAHDLAVPQRLPGGLPGQPARRRRRTTSS